MPHLQLSLSQLSEYARKTSLNVESWWKLQPDENLRPWPLSSWSLRSISEDLARTNSLPGSATKQWRLNVSPGARLCWSDSMSDRTISQLAKVISSSPPDLSWPHFCDGNQVPDGPYILRSQAVALQYLSLPIPVCFQGRICVCIIALLVFNDMSALSAAGHLIVQQLTASDWSFLLSQILA